MPKNQRAADMPDGTVVVTDGQTFIKNHPLPNTEWSGSDGRRINNAAIDMYLDGGLAVVQPDLTEEN